MRTLEWITRSKDLREFLVSFKRLAYRLKKRTGGGWDVLRVTWDDRGQETEETLNQEPFTYIKSAQSLAMDDADKRAKGLEIAA
jgi:YD repeat-containing protein